MQNFCTDDEESYSDLDIEINDDAFDDMIDFNEKEDIKEMREPDDLKISTISMYMKFCNGIQYRLLYENIPINDEIIYVKFNDNIRGMKEEKTKRQITKFLKNKKKRTNDFNNQVSVGILGNLKNHKQPINVKIFKNGSILMVGCKAEKEGEYVYNVLKKYLENLYVKFILEDTKEEVKVPIINEINDIKDTDLKIANMVNCTFKINYKVNLEKMYRVLQELNIPNISILYTPCISSGIRIYLEEYYIYDKKKNQKKTPSICCFKESVNMNVPKKDFIEPTHKFIKKFLREQYKKIVELSKPTFKEDETNIKKPIFKKFFHQDGNLILPKQVENIL